MDEIYKRASVREYSDEAVTDADIEQMLRAAMAAPSAGNQRPWRFYVTRDAAVRDALSKASKFAGPAAKAPVVIAVCMAKDDLRFPGCAPQDLSACVENLLLAATSLDLGAVWLGIAPDVDRMAKVAQALSCESDHEPFALVALGHPKSDPVARGAERYDPAFITWR